MVELIVWILREVFGSQEPPARVGPRPGPSDSYGPPQGGSQQPKTLAELLKEARRELDDGGARPTPPPAPRPAPTPPAQEAPAPCPAKRQDVPASRSTIPAPAAPTPPTRMPEQRQLKQLDALASLRQQNVAEKQRQNQRTERQPQKKTKGKAGTGGAAAAAKVSISAPRHARTQRALAPWVAAMQSEKPALRRQAAIIALVGGVVLGPPKCRQRR